MFPESEKQESVEITRQQREMEAEMTVSIFIFICSQLARMGVNSGQGLDPAQERFGGRWARK